MSKQRLVRVLVYEGDSTWIAEVLARRGVKGSHIVADRGIIREAIVGDFLQTFDEPEQCPDCGRRKAVDADTMELGDCPKWYAVHDQAAEDDCRAHTGVD